jgi:drug/metabolite transporter (DMT)-like permease
VTLLANTPFDNKRRGVLLAFGGMLAVSTDSLFIRISDAEGFDITFWVGVFTAIVMATVVVFHQQTTPLALLRRDGPVLLLAASLQAAMTTFFVLALKNTSVSNVVVIIAAAPLFAAGFGWLWLREKTSRRVWIAIAVSVVGILIVMSGSIGGGSFRGDVLAVGAIASFSLGIVLLRRYPAISRTMVVGLGGAIMALIAVWPAQITGHNSETWLSLVAMGAVFGPLSRVMLAAAPRFLSAAEVGLFAPVETVFASFWVFLFFGEAPVAATWIGGGIVLGALLWGTTGSSSSVS